MPGPVHARTQVRNALKALLTGLATTGDQVFVGRTRQLGSDHPPALLIYTNTTDFAVEAQHTPRPLANDLQLFVEGRVVKSAPPDDILDQIELEVATAIGADTTLGGLIKDIVLRRSTTSAQAPGERHEGEVRMEFMVEYRTPENAPGTFV
jgi:hypothetical protein